MDQGFFITGTDTNVGKTWASVALMRYFKAKGKSVIGLKPVASGSTLTNGVLVNSDALLLQKNATIALDYHMINPYAFESPVSPHIAGRSNPVDLDNILLVFNCIKDRAQIMVVEGAGGWYSPLNDRQQNSHLAGRLGLPVVIVVPIKLGCINHAKLTYQAIIQEGSVCAGWIAVCIEPDVVAFKDILATLKVMLDIPLFGILPHQKIPDFDILAKHLVIVTCNL